MGVLRDRMVREMPLREFSASTQQLYLATLTDLAKSVSGRPGGGPGPRPGSRNARAIPFTTGRVALANASYRPLKLIF